MPQPLVHVLVINWNGKEHLEACFDSLLNQTYSNFRAILVDNASTDGSVHFVREKYGRDARVEILECGTNLGWSRGNNLGINRSLNADADYIFLLNNDTATAPDAIERLVDFAKTHPEAGAIAPKMLLFNQPYLINSIGIACSIVGSAWDEGLGRVDGSRWSEPKQILGVCGGAMFLRSYALRTAGILPDDFEIYLDDLDLCLRVWDAGYECWSCPSATVRHKFSATMGEGPRARRKYYLNTRNRMRLILRNYPSSKFARVFAHYVVSEIRAIGSAARKGEMWRIAAHLRSWATAIGYVPRALAHRREFRSRGHAPGGFWPLIRTDIHFFGGIELPLRGWYSPRTISGVQFRPMSSRASIDIPEGELSLTHVNCYPHLGASDIELVLNGRRIGGLTTAEPPCTEQFALEGGTLEFVSRHIFDAGKTGEDIDIGGWISLQSVTSD